MSMHVRTLLVRPKIGMWTARKYDRAATDEIESLHNANDAGRFNKRLIAKDRLKPIERIINEARNYHYSVTLPWEDEGARILPTKLYIEYAQKIGSIKSKFESAVNDFMLDYSIAISEAQRSLGSLFNPADYPPEESVRKSFYFDVSFYPLPHKDDFRVDILAEDMDRIRLDVEKKIIDAEKEAMKDVWRRVFSAVEKMYDKLSDPDGVFRDTLVGNLTDLVEILPALNISEDPDLDAMKKEIEMKLLVSPEVLRRDATARKSTAEEAAKIIAKMNSYRMEN